MSRSASEVRDYLDMLREDPSLPHPRLVDEAGFCWYCCRRNCTGWDDSDLDVT